MGQSSGILTVKAGLGIPWKHNYFEKSSHLYAGEYFIHRFLERFFSFLLRRGLTYKIEFLKFYNIQDFLSIYYKGRRIRKGRRLFANWPIPGFLISQIAINYMVDWAVISMTAYHVELNLHGKHLLGSLWQLRCFYDSLPFLSFDF